MVRKIPYLLLLCLLAFSGCSAKNKISKSNIEAVLNNSAQWQIKNFKYVDSGSAGYLHDYGIDAWTNAVFYLGLFDWAQLSDNNDYLQWLYTIGERNNWSVPQNFSKYKSIDIYHADELCVS